MSVTIIIIYNISNFFKKMGVLDICLKSSLSYKNALDASHKCYWAFGTSGHYISTSHTSECVIAGAVTHDFVTCKKCYEVNFHMLDYCMRTLKV